MMTDNETEPFGGYSFALRTFEFKGVDLSVFRLWRRDRLIDSDAASGYSTSIRGKAISKDGVRVIREDEVGTKEFELIIRSDANAKQRWETARTNEEVLFKNDGTTPAQRLRAIQFERFSQNPPTAFLGVFGARLADRN
jgi:hypothetical protein